MRYFDKNSKTGQTAKNINHTRIDRYDKLDFYFTKIDYIYFLLIKCVYEWVDVFFISFNVGKLMQLRRLTDGNYQSYIFSHAVEVVYFFLKSQALSRMYVYIV